MKRALLILGYLIFTIAMGAVGDGLNNAGIQTWGHLINAFEIALLLFAVPVLFLGEVFRFSDVFILVAAYAFIRAGIFDTIRNLAAGQDIFYMGGQNWWDMFFVKFPLAGVLFAKAIFLIVGISIPIKYLRR